MRGKEGIEGGAISKNVPALDDLEGSRPFQIPSSARSSKFHFEKARCGQRPSVRLDDLCCGDEGCDLWIQSNISAEARTRDGLLQEGSVENSLICWWGSP